MKKSKVIFLALLACAFGASARDISLIEAKSAARAWVRRGEMFGARFPSDIAERAVAHTTTNGATFYTVKMVNGGTVFMSGDSQSAPVICFTSDKHDFSTIDMKSPLWALLNRDVSNRKSPASGMVLATMATASLQTTLSANERTWVRLIDEGEELAARPRFALSAAAIEIKPGDLRVDMIMQSTWDQGDAGGGYHKSNDSTCYNYYTPQDASGSIVEGDKENAVCGCVATAMSQIMFTHKFPESALAGVYDSSWYGTTEIDLPVSGEAYAWDTMEASPQATASEDVRKAIGLLTADAGRSVGMHYTRDDSGSFAFKARKAMTDVFKYAEAAYVKNNGIGVTKADAIGKIMFANFDAGYPVMLGISGAGGHEIVGDGYGFQADVPYVHLNMGWSGQDNIWYNLPDIGSYNSVDDVVYNIFPDKADSGIISGRVTNADGEGFAGVEVEITDGGETIKTTTSESGVWSALVKNGSYAVSFRDPVRGWTDTLDAPVAVMAPIEEPKKFRWVTPIYNQTQDSKDAEEGEYPAVQSFENLGNSWGNDLVLVEPTVRIVVGTETNLYTSLDKALKSVSEGDTVEILKSTVLRKTMEVGVDCMIVATNGNPAASAIVCVNGAQLEIADGATVAISNVAFDVEYETTVVVSTGGVLRVGGYCGLGTVCAETNYNLVVASELTYAFAVDCACAAGLNMTFALGADDLDYLTASNCANKLLHAKNTRWGGEAYTNAEGKAFFRWSNTAVVPDEAAVAKLVVDGKSRNYRAIDDILEDIEGATGTNEIAVVKNYAFASNYMVRANCHLFMYGFGDARPVLTPGGESGFVVEEDGSLVVSNLVFSGYRDADATDGVGFICVKGGELTLESGAELNDMFGMAMCRSGVIDVLAGTLTMRSGSAILGCTANGGGSKGYGGAIYAFATNSCQLNLEGGTISNCYATAYGGGIYVDEKGGSVGSSQSATVKLSGDIAIVDNTSSPAKRADDLCILNVYARPRVQVVGNLIRRVGMRYSASVNLTNKPGGASVSGIDAGDAFITNLADTTDRSAFHRTLQAFKNDAYASLMATTNATGQLIWKQIPDDGTCEEEEASAHVYQLGADGEELPVKHYFNLATALEYMTSGTTNRIEMYIEGYGGPEVFYSDMEIPSGCQVVLMSRDADAYEFSRTNDVGLTVAAGASLVLTNICFDVDGSGFTRPYIKVDGGKLTLAAGATLTSGTGNTTRDANGITVYNGGVFTMLPGAEIYGCFSSYNRDKVNPSTPSQYYSVGGGLLLDGSTAYLRGGKIYDCRAARGGGVDACNGSKVYVSGDMEITGNKWLTGRGRDGGNSNLQIEDLSELYLDGALVGKVGTCRGVTFVSDTNLVAQVSYVWTNDVAALARSATNFVNDVTGDVGTVLTNGANAIIVWSQALKDGAYVRMEGGKPVRYEVADCARIIDAAGRSTYWLHVEDALRRTSDGCTVETFRDDDLLSSVVLRGSNVTLRAACGVLGGYDLYRAKDASIAIPSGCGLSITNMNFSGERDKVGSTNSFFDVRGGLLKIDNVGVYKMTGCGESNATAIAVMDGGRFEMYNSEISCCSNRSEAVSGVGAGGGLFVDGDGASAYLLDGFVSRCSAAKGGGVFACNGAKVYVADHMCVCDNQNLDKEDSNLELSDSAELIVMSELTGLIGMTPKSLPLEHPCDTNLVASVAGGWKWTPAALTNSAAAFSNDLDGDVGAAVTNGTRALIVWCGALKDGLYVHSDGKVYALVTGEPGEEPSEGPVEGPLPELAANASENDINAALQELDDSAPAEKITTIEEYNKFRDWAQDVGVDDVAASPYSYLSYEFGTEALLENEPTVEITEVANNANGLTVSVVVKDGENPVAVASEKVAKMFEATSDVGNWKQKVELTVSDLANTTSDEVQFTVVPKGNPATTFIRLKY